MSGISLSATIKLRSDSISEWIAHDPILPEGELSVVKVNDSAIQLKFGTGAKYSGTNFVKFHTVDVGDSTRTVSLKKTGIKIEDITSNGPVQHTVSFPSNKTGTIALTSDLPMPATQSSNGLLSKDDKKKLDSYTDDDVAKWKDAYDRLNAIQTAISSISFTNDDSVTVGDIGSVLEAVLTAFKNNSQTGQ